MVWPIDNMQRIISKFSFFLIFFINNACHLQCRVSLTCCNLLLLLPLVKEKKFSCAGSIFFDDLSSQILHFVKINFTVCVLYYYF